MLKKVTIFMITLFALLSGTASAQEFAVKSNLLYDVTSTVNLGGGVRFFSSLDVGGVRQL